MGRLRLHVLIIVAAILAVHALCFALLLIFLRRQTVFITDISAAGACCPVLRPSIVWTLAIRTCAGACCDVRRSLKACPGRSIRARMLKDRSSTQYSSSAVL
jgi:hypothetical protein